MAAESGAARSRRAPLSVALAGAILAVLVAVGATVSLDAGADEGPAILQSATLVWSVSEELNAGAFDGSCNHLSAGRNDGSPSGYRGVDGDVTVEKRTSAGTFTPVSDWASRCNDADGVKVTAGGAGRLGVRVRLTGGEGTHDPATGATTVKWVGTFSANLYDELVPLWFSNPTLVVDASGSATLSADLGGFASSLENPDVRFEIPALPDMVIARFTGVAAAGTTGFTSTPHYAGVPYESAEAPQVRNTANWGSWPTPMVDAMVRTGTASYWYSTGGGADARKAPAPVTVDFGRGIPSTTSTSSTAPTTTAPTTTAPTTTAPTTTAPAPTDDPTADDPVSLAASSSTSRAPASVAGSSSSRASNSSTSTTAPSAPSVLAAVDDAAAAAVGADAPSAAASSERTMREVGAALRYTGMSTVYQPSWNPAAPGSVAISYTVENTGEVTLGARGTARVATSLGPSAADVRTSLEPLAPGRHRTRTEVVDGVWPAMGIETVVRLEPFVPAEPSLDLTAATITARSTATVWPWQQVLVVALLAVAAAGCGIWLWQRNRSHPSDAAPPNPPHA